MLRFRECGVGVQIFDPVAFLRLESIVIKNHVIFSEFSYIAGGIGVYIGNFVHLSTHSSISGGGCCIIEDFSGLSAGARVISGSDDFLGEGIPAPAIPKEINMKYRKVTRTIVHLQRHTMVGTNTVIFPGVTIGEGAVVGAGSIVTHDLEPWGVYMGAPAKFVKSRPRERVLELGRMVYEETDIKPSDTKDYIIHMKSILSDFHS